MTQFSTAQEAGLAVAHAMVDAGIPVFAAPRNHTDGGAEFLYPKGWETTKPSHDMVDRWRPDWALCAVMGVVCDVLDTDPRNGGVESRADLVAAGVWPRVYGVVDTPGGGTHEYITRTHVAKAVLAAGVDLQAGEDNALGRGFVFLPPTERKAKGGPREGQIVEYAWSTELDLDYLTDWTEEGDGTTEAVANLVRQGRERRTPVSKKGQGVKRVATDDDDPFDTVYSAWDEDSANRVIQSQLAAVEAARDGTVNNALGGAARLIGRFVGGGFITESQAADMLLEALERGGVHSDRWNIANGRKWTANTVIQAGLTNGQDEPWEVMIHEEPSVPIVVEPSRAAPNLNITSAPDMTYWLESALGTGATSGFFRRMGQIVHTPRMAEIGYVPPANGDENGWSQIQAVAPGQLAAKLQFLYRCFKVVKDKKTDEEFEVLSHFPLESAKRAVDAPEAMVSLRPLAGVTNTPMVRQDGSILDHAGYDDESAFLFLPGYGVNVPPVPTVPNDAEVASAVALLDEMTAGFPWDSKEDRANYYGLLLTPLLRMLAPPSYKAFFIGAHQPGSGKTLLADIARIIHGGVLRSEMPMDEPEIKKMTTALLATTSAPIVHVDNVTGVLKSPTLAGILTSSGEMEDRELGKTGNVRYVNDRVWVFTGNNPSLGGDLVRRTITIMIDPNMANPERREFAIKDLPAWVTSNRNRLLHALMIMVRNWVAKGALPAVRTQSDSFARWESVVAGILETAGVMGAFDQDSGRRAMKGGDDDGLAGLLEHIAETFGDRPWTVSELLTAEPDEFRADSREWLPAVILDKLQRSEAGGKKSLGRWLMNRAGRWITTEEGNALVIREAGRNRNKIMMWKVEAPR